MSAKVIRTFFTASCGLVAAGCAGRTVQPSTVHATTSPVATPTGSEPYHGLIQYRAKDAKVAIVKPEMVPADQALIAPGTKVIGVFVNGEARAYPLFILNNHQIVNDQVGGIPLSASW